MFLLTQMIEIVGAVEGAGPYGVHCPVITSFRGSAATVGIPEGYRNVHGIATPV